MSDELFDRVVRKPLRRGIASDPCPDPSEVAAFIGNNLTAAERRRIETHVSSCARCAAELAVLVRLEEPAQSRARAASWWPRLRWAIPVATAVLVFVVWREMPREPQRTDMVTDVPTIIAPPSRDASPRNARSAKDDTSLRRRGQATVSGASKPALSQERRSRAEADQTRQGALADARAEPSERKELEAGRGNESLDKVAPVTQPAAPPAAAAPQSGPTDREAARSTAAQKVERVPLEGVVKEEFRRQSSVMAETVSSGLVVPATDRVQVRVIDGTIERSLDQGRTWRVERDRLPALPSVGVCPSVDVCWLAGESGFVVRRETSGRWLDARLPVDASVTSISATDALHATALTVDRRRFSTADGGRTWVLMP